MGPMRKISRSKMDKLFEGMAHDLYSKFEENVMAIHENLFSESNVAVMFERRQLIRNRLMIEFGYVRAAEENKEVRNAAKEAKKDSKKKSSSTSPKKLVSATKA
jgi:hypothetical protein